jgi:hypothetical protein
MVKESVLLYGHTTGGAQLRGGYAQNLPQAATDFPQPPRYKRGGPRVSLGKWLGSSTRLLSHQRQCWSDMLRNHLSGRSPLRTHAGGARVQSVRGGKASRIASNQSRLLSSFSHNPIEIPRQIIFVRHRGYREVLKARLLQSSLNHLPGCEVDGFCRIFE